MQPTVNQYGSVDPGNAPNGHVPPYDRSLTPLLHDFTDPNMCYIPNGYPSTAYYFGGKRSRSIVRLLSSLHKVINFIIF